MDERNERRRRIIADLEQAIAMLRADGAPSMTARSPGETQEATIERLEKSAADLRRLVEAWRQKS